MPVRKLKISPRRRNPRMTRQRDNKLKGNYRIEIDKLGKVRHETGEHIRVINQCHDRD